MSAPRKPTKPKAETAKEKAERARSAEAQARDKSRRKLWSLILFSVGLLLIVFSFIGNIHAEEKNAADYINTFLRAMFGFSVFFLGPILIYISVMISMNKGKSSIKAKMIQLGIIVLLLSAGIQVIFYGTLEEVTGGGWVSYALGWLLPAFGRIAASIIIILITFIVFMLASDITLHEFLRLISKPFSFIGNNIKEKGRQLREDSEYLRMLAEENKKLDKAAMSSDIETDTKKKLKAASILAATSSGREPEEPLAESVPDLHNDFREKLNAYTDDEQLPPPPEPPEEKQDEFNPFFKAVGEYIKEREEQDAQNELNAQTLKASVSDEFAALAGSPDNEIPLYEPNKIPSSDLLDNPVSVQGTLDIEIEIRQNAETLVKTLQSFGVKTEYVGHSRGPSVTRYELKPAEGVKISKITSLVDDIALNLATSGVRIEAPIPNKSAVGIEVPNRKAEMVYIRSLIESDVYKKHESKLATVIGKDLSNEIVVCDIATMPHILIAGTTGSGKSVCVNDMILSILFRATPDEVRFVMIDPKMVEFKVYNGIPHLLFPVFTDPKKAAGALVWAVKEMLERYKIFADEVVRDLAEYNKKPGLEKKPQIVVFIDELADLMMVASNEVEDSICRLAQMGRAAGIHLVIATQRPSVDVITGIIKANIPSRIALKVASQVDSRTIIDSAGAAEKLLGKGDMLYNPMGASKPTRVQGCWISVKEVERTVEFFKKLSAPDYDENAMKEIEENASLVGLSKSDKEKRISDIDELDISDDRLDEAIDAVIEAGQASTSYLQRKLKLGYGRAARLIDIMEQMGVVGTFEGSKPRQVIMTRQQWYERKINRGD
jgi:S-DNA-T family DNA segregation ATPase FtsK/SpoIIIE